MNLDPYLKIVSPARTSLLHEMKYNSLVGNQMQENDSRFCDNSNSDECIEYLDQELRMLGFQTLYANNMQFDLTALLNTTHDLLQKYQRSSRYREELETRVHRSCTDLEHLQSSHKKLKTTNQCLQNDVAKSEEAERRLQLENSSLKAKLKAHSDEIKRLKSQLQSNENQYRHEVKKKERQMTLLKERAQHLLTEKGRGVAVPSMEISYCLPRADGSRSKWRNEASSNRYEEELHQSVVANYERRCTGLLSENNRLREMLGDVQLELQELCPPEAKTVSPSSKEQMQLPLDSLHHRLAETLRHSCEVLRNRLSSLADCEGLNRTYSLEEQNATFTIGGSDMRSCSTPSKYRKSLDQKSTRISRDQSESLEHSFDLSVLDEQESLSREKVLLYKQKAQLEQEKQSLVEAARSLKKERKKVEDLKRKLISDSPGSLGASLNNSFSSSRSPRPERISEHIENVKWAVEERYQTPRDNKE